jgi:ubiquitin thioesterase OTU1
MTKAPQMRKIISEGIKSNPETYTEAILGMAPAKYIDTITKPSTWGGAIELSILAAHYRTEIASIDVETGRIDHFTPLGDFGASMRCIVIYSGIHYDAATLAPMPDAPAEWHQTLFEITSSDDSDPMLIAGKKLVDILRSKKAFTNTATFDLKCEQCGQGLKGEKEARAHAEQTGHTKFGEY